MKQYLDAFRRLAPWQKIVAAAMLFVIVLTWLAVCLVLTGVVGP